MSRRKAAFLILFEVLLAGWLLCLPKDLFQGTSYATVVTDRNGELLGARIAGDQQWRFPPCDTVPDRFATALIQFEDRHFRWHPGVNPVALVRASADNLRAGHVVSGGSTLTMQVIRLRPVRRQCRGAGGGRLALFRAPGRGALLGRIRHPGRPPQCAGLHPSRQGPGPAAGQAEPSAGAAASARVPGWIDPGIGLGGTAAGRALSPSQPGPATGGSAAPRGRNAHRHRPVPPAAAAARRSPMWGTLPPCGPAMDPK